MEIIITILSSAVISSIVTALLAPHVNWGIEKKKIKLQNQKELICNLRTLLDKKDFSREDFRDTQIYSQIRPFLSEGIIKKNRIIYCIYTKGNWGLDKFRHKNLN